MAYNLLSPSNLQQNYINQLRQTIEAYDPAQVVIGEALQNALDAVVEAGGGHRTIKLTLDFDSHQISVEDDGPGFPNDPTLLFLGGSLKTGKKLLGLVGVGIKVVLFRSSSFRLRSRMAETGESFAFEIQDAFRFDEESPPALEVPMAFPEDEHPLPHGGTEVTYQFPQSTDSDVVAGFLHLLQERCLPRGPAQDFGKTLESAVLKEQAPTRFAGLLASFIRRYTYGGDVLNKLGDKLTLAETAIVVRVTGSDPPSQFGELGELFDGQTDFEFEVTPRHLTVEDTVDWGSDPKPGIYRYAIGRGGSGLPRTYRGFNIQVFKAPEEYERLLESTRGRLPEDIEEYRSQLFPRINALILVIGRIPLLEEYLPGGSRRVLSCNGVITAHDLDLTKGRNQEYVRCFDLIIDVDATLNYGKTQITDRHLVSRVRRFVNDAYGATIQNAAGSWVGKIEFPEEEEAVDVFLGRPDLGIDDFVLRKAPRDENDVIALYFELAGRGAFPDYRFYGLSQIDTYDARAAIRREGDSPQVLSPTDERELRVVEFKVLAASVIPDLDRGRKVAREIDLLVAWDEGVSPLEQYGFGDVEQSRAYRDKKAFPSVQRFLEDTQTGAQIQILLLKPIVEGSPES